MRRESWMILFLGLSLLLTGCTARAAEHSGTAQGYGGPLTVTVKMDGATITHVKVTSHSETPGVGTRAIDALPGAIAKAGHTEVDDVSGATITSRAIKEAVRQAAGLTGTLDDPLPTVDMAGTQAIPTGDDVRSGVGLAVTGRIGPGTGVDDQQVYGVNVVFAAGLFDAQGRILHLDVDQMEFFSPNMAGGSVFSGFPQGEEDREAFLDEVSGWVTKGALAEGYTLESGTWREQMDAYQRLMQGMTIDEVEGWFADHFDQETGRPLASGEAYDALSDAQKRTAADIASSATMSLRGEHGDILLAIRRAWEDAQRGSAPAQETPAGDTALPTDALEDGASAG